MIGSHEPQKRSNHLPAPWYPQDRSVIRFLFRMRGKERNSGETNKSSLTSATVDDEVKSWSPNGTEKDYICTKYFRISIADLSVIDGSLLVKPIFYSVHV